MLFWEANGLDRYIVLNQSSAKGVAIFNSAGIGFVSE